MRKHYNSNNTILRAFVRGKQELVYDAVFRRVHSGQPREAVSLQHLRALLWSSYSVLRYQECIWDELRKNPCACSTVVDYFSRRFVAGCCFFPFSVILLEPDKESAYLIQTPEVPVSSLITEVWKSLHTCVRELTFSQGRFGNALSRNRHRSEHFCTNCPLHNHAIRQRWELTICTIDRIFTSSATYWLSRHHYRQSDYKEWQHVCTLPSLEEI